MDGARAREASSRFLPSYLLVASYSTRTMLVKASQSFVLHAEPSDPYLLAFNHPAIPLWTIKVSPALEVGSLRLHINYALSFPFRVQHCQLSVTPASGSLWELSLGAQTCALAGSGSGQITSPWAYTPEHDPVRITVELDLLPTGAHEKEKAAMEALSIASRAGELPAASASVNRILLTL